jgi:hypothetical protein
MRKKKLFQDDSSQFWKKARENYVTSGHVTDVTSDYGVTSGHMTDVTFGYEDTSGRVTDVTSSYVATSISTEQVFVTELTVVIFFCSCSRFEYKNSI